MKAFYMDLKYERNISNNKKISLNFKYFNLKSRKLQILSFTYTNSRN